MTYLNGKLTILKPLPLPKTETIATQRCVVITTPAIRKHIALIRLSRRSFTFYPNLDANQHRITEGVVTLINDTLAKVELYQTDSDIPVTAEGQLAIDILGAEVIAMDIDPIG